MCRLSFSHDDRIKIFRVMEKRQLEAKLKSLSFHSAGEGE
jgi:hypothetical protein